MMETSDFPATLMNLANRYEIPLSRAQTLLCQRHVSLMLEWNSRCNLTRITGYREIIEKHLLDSLIPARWLPISGPAVDIGSGPGFPGIPLKILHPELHMLLLESHRRKVSFLRIALAGLSLPGIAVLQGRWEELPRMDHPLIKAPFTLATMRAVKLEARHLVVASSMLLGQDGIFAWWAGPSADQKWCEENPELFEIGGMSFEGRRPYYLPSTPQPRYIYVWRKQAAVQKEPGKAGFPPEARGLTKMRSVQLFQ